MFTLEDNSTPSWKPATQEEITRVKAIMAEKDRTVVIVRGTLQSQVRYMISLIPSAFLWFWRNSIRRKRKTNVF